MFRGVSWGLGPLARGVTKGAPKQKNERKRKDKKVKQRDESGTIQAQGKGS